MKFKLPLNWLSLRGKIIALLLATLVLSLSSYLLVGTSVIRQEKLSDIHDSAAARVQALSQWIEGQVDTSTKTARTLAQIYGVTSVDQFSKLFKKLSQSKIESMILMRPEGASQFRASVQLGENAEMLKPVLVSQGWTPQAFEQNPTLIGPLSGSLENGLLTIGTLAQDSAGKPLAILMNVRLTALSSEQLGASFSYALYGPDRKLIFSSGENAKAGTAPQLDRILQELSAQGFTSGTKTVLLGAEPQKFILTYQKFLGNRFILIGTLPESKAFAAIRSLTWRSIALGISILLLAIGASLLLIRGMTLRLKQIWKATLKISEGDFSVRVDSTSGPDRDEVSGLAHSFNLMADKIGELMKATADKARMEKEIETAKMVQSRYFPSAGFTHSNLSLVGKTYPASECSGDWWYHAQIGDWMICFVGDVTGHGVSAALITSAVYSAFSIAIQEFKANPGQRPSIKSLMNRLNLTVRSAGEEGAYMTGIAILIDLKTGGLEISNASHPFPYIWRGEINPIQNGMVRSPLGFSLEADFTPAQYQLSPGDTLYVFSDGVFETGQTGKVLRKSVWANELAQASQKFKSNLSALSTSILAPRLTSFTNGQALQPDDITLIVAQVPTSARWENKASIPQELL